MDYAFVESLGPLALFSFIATITPGPNNIYLATIGAARGVGAGLPYLIGVIIGFFAVILFAASGFGAVLEAMPQVRLVLVVVSSLFLLYMAWGIAMADPVGSASDSNGNGGGKGLKQIGWVSSLMFQAVNPKGWAAATAAVSLYFDLGSASFIETVIRCGLFTGITFFCSGSWLIFGTMFRKLLQSPRFGRGFNVSMAGLLLLLVVSMVLQQVG